MKKIKDQNKILIMLAFFSISVGLWGNFRQLWLQNNNLPVTQISTIISLGTLASVIAIILIGKYVKLSKLKNYVTYSIFLKFINLIFLYLINEKGLDSLIRISIVVDIILEYIIIASVYPLITCIIKNDKEYSKRQLTEYLFRDVGILLGGLVIGKCILGIIVDYNVCLIIANIFLFISLLIILKINTNIEEIKENEKKESILKYICKRKIIVLFLLYVFIGTAAMQTALGLKMLTLTNYFKFTDSLATNYLLLIGLIADGIGIVALKFLTPKNDYITITIKFGIRFLAYVIAFLSNNIFFIFIAMTWSILISTAYENVCDGPYINSIENEYLLEFTNFRYIVRFSGEAVGIFFCGIMYEIGLKYMFGLSAIFMIFQIGLAYYLIYLRKSERMHCDESRNKAIK